LASVAGSDFGYNNNHLTLTVRWTPAAAAEVFSLISLILVKTLKTKNKEAEDMIL